MSSISALPGAGQPAALQREIRVPHLARGLAAPFDAVRQLHAQAVRAGLVQRSILENAKFERALASLEQLALGPFARTR